MEEQAKTKAPPTDVDMTDARVADLWHFYTEHAAQARQHETLRATVASILGAFAAALVGFTGVGGLHRSDVPAGVMVFVIGLLGALLSLKHYERNRFHTSVLGAVRREIESARGRSAVASLGSLRDKAKPKPQGPFARWIIDIHLYQLWVGLNLAVAAVGVVIVVISATS